MTSQHRKHRGYRSQKVWADYLVENGFPYAESAGAGRSGSDITGTGIDWELKARTGFNPSAVIKQLKERSKAGKLQIAVLRLNGQGEESVGEWLMILRAEDGVRLLNEAGRGTK